MSHERKAVLTFKGTEFASALEALVTEFKEKGMDVTLEHNNPSLASSSKSPARIEYTPREHVESAMKYFEQKDYDQCGEHMWLAVRHTVQMYFLEKFKIDIVSEDAAEVLADLAIRKCPASLKNALLLGWGCGQSIMNDYINGCQKSLEYDIGCFPIQEFVDGFPGIPSDLIQKDVEDLIKKGGCPKFQITAKKGTKRLCKKELPYEYKAE